MGKRCCECGNEIVRRMAYFFETKAACSARCAALRGLKSLKNPGNLERKFKDELVKNQTPLRSEANTKAK